MTGKNFRQLKVLNDVCLPIKYGEGFYNYIVYGHRFVKMAYYKDVLVGALSWKIDPASEHTPEKEEERLKKLSEEAKGAELG